MARAKKKKVEEDDFEAYAANILKSYEITPEKRAAAHALMKEEATRARAAGVYQRLQEIREQNIRERQQSMLRDGKERKLKK